MRHRRLAVLALLAGMLMLLLVQGGAAAKDKPPKNAKPAAARTITPAVKHIFVIMLENHSKSSVIGNANAPYISGLASSGAMAANYYGVTHPSLPNYVAAISGSNWFVNDDNPNNRFDHTNLVDQLEANKLTWGAYMESMPTAGYLSDY